MQEKKTNKCKYRFSNGKGTDVIFDSKGRILNAKGFGLLMWSRSENIDRELIGKSVDELAKMLKEHGGSKEIYYNFEIQVHLELLKSMLENA